MFSHGRNNRTVAHYILRSITLCVIFHILKYCNVSRNRTGERAHTAKYSFTATGHTNDSKRNQNATETHIIK